LTLHLLLSFWSMTGAMDEADVGQRRYHFRLTWDSRAV
jgi:hypothetical protein